MASKRFIFIIVDRIGYRREKKKGETTWEAGVEKRRRISRLAATASRMLVSGPLSATNAISFLPSRRLNGSTGTGFAAPIKIGEPDIKSKIGSRMLENVSM